jgi:recombination protein RecT
MSQAVALRHDVIDLARVSFEAVSVDKSINFEREAGFATQTLMASEYAMRIALMNPQSVINAVTNIAAIGISLNPAKRQAYLVPRDNRICLDIGYIGLLDLAIQGGAIKWGQAELVHAADRFVLNGVDKPPTHERDPFSTDRGEVIGAYVVVKTADGDYLTTPMSTADIFDIRDRSSAWKAWVEKKKKCPWVTDEGEMMKKTVIKRAYKLWPKTDKLDRAIHYLNTEGEEGLPALDNEPVSQPKDFGLTPARAKIIRAVANAALQKFNEGDEWGAYVEAAQIDDTEERIALWTVLKPHSALRSSIKRHAEEQRKRDEELAKMPPPTVVVEEPAA